MAAAPAAVIFDVDGVLLDLTPPEEDAFFAPFARRHGLAGLSRDWDSYRVRNDEEIIRKKFSSDTSAPPAKRRRVPSAPRTPISR